MLTKDNWKKIYNRPANIKNFSYSFKNKLILNRHLKNNSTKKDLYNWINTFKRIKNKIFVKNGKILEIGCGSGALLDFFSKGMNVYGVDNSKYLLNIAKETLPNGIFYLKNAENINFKKNFFDSIVLYSCIQYFPNKNYLKKVLSKVFFCLKPNGFGYLGDIMDKNKFSKLKEYRLFKKNFLIKNRSKLKYLSFSRKEIISLLKNQTKYLKLNNSRNTNNKKYLELFDCFFIKK